MKTLEVSATNRQLRKMIAEAQVETVVLAEDGKPVAAIVPIRDMDAESLSLGTNPKFLRLLRRSFRQLDRGKRVSLPEMRKRLRMAQ
jgi:antitoxin (DNA-binding transcriptional repressor) of toxin-antitoxin stability system